MLTGTFNAAEVFLFLFFLHLSPDLYLHTILSQQFISTINYGTLYRRCVLFKIMSNLLNLPQMDFSHVVETSDIF